MIFIEGGNRPGGEQFAEGSASDQAFAVGNPVDLVGNIKAAVAEARANWKVDAEFNPVWWLDWQLESIANHAYFDSIRVSLPQLEREIADDKNAFFDALHVAWKLVTYEQGDGENNYSIYSDIRGYASAYQTRSVTLPPLGVTLLDAMAEALDIPHKPGQAKFNVEPLLTGATEKVMRGQNPMPTNEEVKRAIALNPENMVDADQ